MNILFQLVDLYDIVRQKEKYYELPRVKVYPTDSLIPPEPMELAEFFENSRRKMLIEETKGANRVKGINFDFVVGNPPYVRKERIRTEYKEKVLAKAYSEVYNGDNDIYVYFVTKGIGWLNESGKLGYIVSGKFTKTRYGEKLRKFILDTCCVEHFLDLRGVKVFREATNDPIILILAKEPSAEKRQVQQIKVVEVKKEDENTRKLMERIKKELNKEIFSDDYLDVFQTSQSLLTKEVWKIVKGKYYELLDKIKSSSNYLLDSLCRITRGIETGRNVSKNGEPVFVFDNERALPSNLERSLLKPLVKGEDMVRWVAIHKGRWIIYDADIEDENYFKSNYPNVYQHLFKFYNELVYKHKNGKDSHPEGRGSQLMKQRIWYELRKPLDREMLENEKILTRRITNEHLFAYDNEKLYPLETCCIIVPKNEHRDVNQIKYITGLLNSKIIEFYLKLTSRHLGKKGYEYEKQYLERLPIKLPQTEEEKEVADKIISKVDQILQLKKEACLLSKRVGEFPDSYFVDSWTFSKLLNAVKSQNLSFSSYAISEKLLRTDYRQRDLDGSETFRIILSTSEFIDFYSEEVASYVLGVLKNINRITKRELLELKIPQQPYLKNLLNQYRKHKEQIVKNEEAVEELEKQIDDIVYKLYDITYPERKIIENYLKKF